jgi:hypothetical protein
MTPAMGARGRLLQAAEGNIPLLGDAANAGGQQFTACAHRPTAVSFNLEHRFTRLPRKSPMGLSELVPPEGT